MFGITDLSARDSGSEKEKEVEMRHYFDYLLGSSFASRWKNGKDIKKEESAQLSLCSDFRPRRHDRKAQTRRIDR